MSGYGQVARAEKFELKISESKFRGKTWHPGHQGRGGEAGIDAAEERWLRLLSVQSE